MADGYTLDPDQLLDLATPLLAEALPIPPEQAVLTALGRRIKAEVRRIHDAGAAAGRRRAAKDVDTWADELADRTARYADLHVTCACGRPALVLTAHDANEGVVAATRKAARIAAGESPDHQHSDGAQEAG